MNDFSEMRCALKTLVENALESSFRDDAIPSHLAEAMRYSLLAGGKRLRPVLNLASALACAESSPGFAESDAERLLKAVLPFASGLEMIHTYSLIHDDLPAMDDDDLRRGRPTCHRAFDEGTAILAGDALLTDAFGFMARASLPAERVLEALALAADAAGAAGMAGGQMLDLDGEGGTLSEAELTELNAKKTGALLRLACESGAVLSGADPARRAALRRYGEELGIAFQITDDILDVTAMPPPWARMRGMTRSRPRPHGPPCSGWIKPARALWPTAARRRKLWIPRCSEIPAMPACSAGSPSNLPTARFNPYGNAMSRSLPPSFPACATPTVCPTASPGFPWRKSRLLPRNCGTKSSASSRITAGISHPPSVWWN